MAERGLVKISCKGEHVGTLGVTPFGVPKDFGKFLCIYCSKPTNANKLTQHLLNAEIIDDCSPVNKCFVEVPTPPNMGDYEYLYEVDFPVEWTTGQVGDIPSICVKRLDVHGEVSEVVASGSPSEVLAKIS